MKFPGAKYGLKMACGENPKRVYAQPRPVDAHGQRRRLSRRMDPGGGVSSPLGQVERGPSRAIRRRAISGLETLAEVLRGNILVHNHCYRADEMAQMIDIANEFGYKIRSFHHGVEAYKIADLLAKEGIGASFWADWGGFKMEAMDARAREHRAGRRGRRPRDRPLRRSVGHAAPEPGSGKGDGGRRTDSAFTITEDQAIKWLTINPAWALGLDDKIGSIEVGKNADVVLWSADPFSVYARADKVWIDGAAAYDRADPSSRWRTDFELGTCRFQREGNDHGNREAGTGMRDGGETARKPVPRKSMPRARDLRGARAHRRPGTSRPDGRHHGW